MPSEGMDCFTAFAMMSLFMESQPYRPGTAHGSWTVIASEAWRSMYSEVMDCFTAACPEPAEGFAMTTFPHLKLFLHG
jgi:hypothetical protein